MLLKSVIKIKKQLEKLIRKNDMNTNELTFGQKMVNFNPANLESVDIYNKNIANALDQLNDLREKAVLQEEKRLCSIAITKLEDAQMSAVKALTLLDN